MDNTPIFTIWLTDKDWDAMPYLYEICIASWKVFNPNRDIIIYSNHKLHFSFLDRTIIKVIQLDEEFPGLYDKAAEICDLRQHQSDYIRFSILKQQPGIYLDTDVLCYNSVDETINRFTESGKDVCFCIEDANMLCNACIISKGKFKDVFDDILYEYETRFIKHSYLFNSQKYLWLMYKRYTNKIHLTIPQLTIFKPTWKMEPDERNALMSPDFHFENGSVQNFSGFGHHLYSSVDNWDKMRDYIDNNIYNKNPTSYITKLTRYVIDKYIDLMKEADNCEQ